MNIIIFRKKSYIFPAVLISLFFITSLSYAQSDNNSYYYNKKENQFEYAVCKDDNVLTGQAAKKYIQHNLQSPVNITSGENEPEYASGEIIVKLRTQTNDIALQNADTLSVDRNRLSELNNRFGLISMDRIFTEKPRETYKGSKTIREAIAKKKRRAELRNARAPKNVISPDLSHIYKLTFSKKANIEEIVNAYNSHQDVEYAEPNYKVKANWYPNDPYYSSSGSWGQPYDDLWGLKNIQTEQAWDNSQGEGIIIAVVDTGIDYTHEDITANIWTNTAEIAENDIDDDGNGYVDDVRGWNFEHNNNDPKDDNGHGTHVSGIIAAIGNNNRGIIGVAPKSKIMTVKGLDYEGYGYTSDLANCIRYAADNGADIINNSWGGEETSILVQDAVTYAYSLGCIIVAAAGNNNRDVSDFCPANLSNVITVAATNRDNKKSSFSNYGTKIDVTAPGTDILSLLASDSELGKKYPQDIVGYNYIRLSGTSMAAPYVSGGIALILSKNHKLSAETIKYILRSSAAPLKYENPYLDKPFGYGVINITAALQRDSACIAKITGPAETDIVKTGTILIQGNASGIKFQNYKIEYSPYIGTGWLPVSPLIYTSVKNNLLYKWNSTIKSNGYYLKITATDTDNYSYPDIIGPVFIFDNNIRDGWPKKIGQTNTYPCPFVIADINNDGIKEIIAGNANGQIHAYSPNGDELKGWPVSINSALISDIVCADIDNDNDLEICFVGSNQYVYAYHHNGVSVANWPCYIGEKNNNYTLSSLVVGDVDNNSSSEIVVLSEGRVINYSYVFNYKGEIVSKWVLDNFKDRKLCFKNGPALADINNDGYMEIIVPMINITDNGKYYIYIFNYEGNIIKTLPLEGIYALLLKEKDQEGNDMVWGIMDGIFSNRPVIGDLDRDGDMEIAISKVRSIANRKEDLINKLFIWSYDNGNYSTITDKEIDTIYGVNLSIANIDTSTDSLELIGGNDQSGVQCFNNKGELLWRRNDNAGDGGFFRGDIVIGDINYDHLPEIVTVTGNSYFNYSTMTIFNNNGSDAFSYKLPLYSPTDFSVPSPAIADIDNNGTTELIAVNSRDGSIMVFDSQQNYNSQFIDWPQYQQNAQHTGLYPSLPAINNAPEFLAPVPVDKKGEEGKQIVFTLKSIDRDNDDLTITVASLPQGALYNTTIQQDQQGNRTYFTTFTWTPTYKQAGSYTPVFIVTDGIESISQKVNIKVTNVNRLPEFEAIPDKEAIEGDYLKFDVRVIDKDGDYVYIGLIGAPPRAYLRRKGSGKAEFRWRIGYRQAGNYTLTLWATDTYPYSSNFKGKKVYATVNIKIIDKNYPPYIYYISDKTVREENLLKFYIRAYDRDRDTLIYTVKNLPQGAKFNSSRKLFTWTPLKGQTGKYTVTFEVSDGTNMVTKNVKITVLGNSGNNAPVLNHIGNRTINEGRFLFIRIKATDKDQDYLRYKASNLPQGARFYSWGRYGGFFLWRPGYKQSGTYQNIHFEVSDGNLTDSEDITITVNEKQPWWMAWLRWWRS